MQKLQLYTATKEDIKTLIEIRLEYINADLAQINEVETAIISSKLTTYLTNNIGTNFIALLGKIDNQVVSCAYLAISEIPANNNLNGRYGTVLNVFTYPNHRNKGYATQVLTKLIEEARAFSLHHITLDASPSAVSLYKKIGFSENKSKYTSMSKLL